MDNSLFKDINSIKKLIGKEVEIKTVDKILHRGNLYVIDPDTGTTIITTNTGEGRINLKIISFHAISSFTTYGEVACSMQIFNDVRKTGEEVEKRKVALIQWLRQNFIDVVDEGNVLKYEDSIVIEPPYELDNCYCNNTVVLDRIRKIISKCP